MQAIISIITGMIGFVIIAGMQLYLLLFIKIYSGNSQLSPALYSIGIETKIVTIILGVIAIASSILYTRTNKYKLRIINNVGMFFGILAIILCFIPLFLIIKIK